MIVIVWAGRERKTHFRGAVWADRHCCMVVVQPCEWVREWKREECLCVHVDGRMTMMWPLKAISSIRECLRGSAGWMMVGLVLMVVVVFISVEFFSFNFANNIQFRWRQENIIISDLWRRRRGLKCRWTRICCLRSVNGWIYSEGKKRLPKYRKITAGVCTLNHHNHQLIKLKVKDREVKEEDILV